MATDECSGEFETAEALPLLWELAATPDNIVFHSPDAELENMAYLHASYRWPAVYGYDGTITVTVPRAGTYYPGVVVYEGETPISLYGMPKVQIPAGEPSFELSVDGRVLGRFTLREKDSRERLYFLDRPVEFKGGERLTVRTGSAGVHIVEDIMLLRMKPPKRERPFEIRHLSAAYVDTPEGGAMRITWVTTWPARCNLEWGPTPRCEQRLTESEAAVNHRILLRNLERGRTYHYRVSATTPHDKGVHSGTCAFTFTAPAPFEGSARAERVVLKVANPHPFDATRTPVTSGVPFAPGELGDVNRCRLLDRDGNEIPSQRRVTGRWEDGSIKWVLLTFPADLPAGETSTFALEYGNAVASRDVATSLSVCRSGSRLLIRNGSEQVEFDSDLSGLPVRMSVNGSDIPMAPLEARVTDGEGVAWSSQAPAELMVLEEQGPLRVVVRTRGHHRGPNGGAFFAYEARFIFYAGLPGFEMRYAWGNDREERFSRFKRVSLRVPLGEGVPRWRLGLDPGFSTAGEGDVRLRQLKDDSYQVEGADTGGAPLRRAEGWIEVTAGRAAILVAVRDFWQLYPRSLGVARDVLEIGVAGDFPANFYEDSSQKELVDLYFHLRGDAWKVRRGVKKWHQILLRFNESQSAPERAAQTAALFAEPPIAVCPPERYRDAHVFGPFAVADESPLDAYEVHCEKVYEYYCRRREEEHWYGQMNYGDLLGENLVSWLNNEYDNAHSFFIQFVRTGDRKWYRLGEQAARHDIDVDVCHYGPETGAEWAHVLGHTGDYFDRDPYGLSRDIDDYGSGNLRQAICGPDHSWVGGMRDWYFLSGDETALGTLRIVADYFSGPRLLNNYDWFAAREAGWHMVLLLTAYEATGDRFYLNGARIILERVLVRQTPGPRGWHHQMVPAHCYCTPPHRGEASYMIAILAMGLELMYEVTHDEKIAEAIVGAADQVIDEMWVEEADAFRATSCPNATWTSQEQMMEMAPLYMSNVAEMLMFAYSKTRRARYRDIAERAVRKTLAARAIGITHMYWMPRLLWYMLSHAPGHARGKENIL